MSRFKSTFIRIKEMTPKEQALKNIEGRIKTIQKLSTECIELIYNAAYNEAIEDVLRQQRVDEYCAVEIRKLKKE